MKKKVTFEKKIDFPTMIGEICAISLEHDLKFIDESYVEGNLLLNGKYKLTEASRLEEDFDFKIPVEIALIEKIDLNTSRIEITDFYYEIENEDVMVCHIELLIEGLEIVEEVLDVSEERECDGDSIEQKEIEIPQIEKKEDNEYIKEEEKVENEEKVEEEAIDITNTVELIENSSINEKNDKEIDKDIAESGSKSLFISMNEETETYGTFIVYIVRQNESINSIIEKYNTSLEELEKYNDLTNLSIGTKLIIPLLND